MFGHYSCSKQSLVCLLYTITFLAAVVSGQYGDHQKLSKIETNRTSASRPGGSGDYFPDSPLLFTQNVSLEGKSPSFKTSTQRHEKTGRVQKVNSDLSLHKLPLQPETLESLENAAKLYPVAMHLSGYGHASSGFPTRHGSEEVNADSDMSRRLTDSTQTKLPQIGERSSVLIERLCGTHGRRREVCYKEHGMPKCDCTGGLADCSGKRFVPNLPYVPRFPGNIKCLRFNYNNVKYLDDSYFTNVSSFLVIDFSYNSLQGISRQTFARFTNLKYLMLNYNSVSYRSLKYVLANPPALRLDVIGNNLEKMPQNYFFPYRDIPTSELYMDFNYMPDLELYEFAVLKNLQYLSLTNCSIKTTKSASMPALRILDLKNNHIVRFPDTCAGHAVLGSPGQARERSSQHTTVFQRTSYFPQLRELYIDSNDVSALPDHTELCLPQVVGLQMKSNNISEIPAKAFTSLRSLKVLTIDKMRSRITKIGASAFSLSRLTSLYMSKNGIDFNHPDVSVDMFECCSALVVLQIDHNRFTGVSQERFSKLLSHVPRVEYLGLGSCGIRTIPVDALAQLIGLKRLYIYINDIDNIPPGAFDKLTSLQFLYMDENKISTIKPDSFSDHTRKRLQQINLSKNPYLCDCDFLWFQNWLNSSGSKVFRDYNDYMCSNIPGTHVQAFSLSLQACLFSRETYILFVVCLSILMTIFIIFALLYRYRWNIRLMLYERRAPARSVAAAETPRNYRYDLFVVYCNDDAEFVEQLLLRKLENQWKLRLCIHQRDFVAGGNIIDNIVEAMNSSRRILVVVSSRFAISKWCNVELQLCQSHIIDHNLPSLLVIKLDDIESRDMSAAMLALFNLTSFLEWPGYTAERNELVLFMKRLERMLKPLFPPATARHQTSVKLRVPEAATNV